MKISKITNTIGYNPNVRAVSGTSSGNAAGRSKNRFQARALLFGVLLVTPFALPAATVWTGPRIAFVDLAGSDPTQAANQDRMTPNVWITRGGIQGIYNAKTENGFAHFLSPSGTEWANGTTTTYNSLSYSDWNTWAKSVNGGPPSTVGVDAVVHLISEDIYIDVKFTFWGGSAGGFAYSRSTPPAANNPPSVTLTNPVNGASFTAPASLTMGAQASDNDGSVTNVQFFDGLVSLGNATTSPYSVPATLQAGTHVLKAVATDNAGASTTSANVTVNVTNANAAPGPLSIQPQGGSVVLNWAGNFPLQTATDLGSSNFVDVAGVTNSPFTNVINVPRRFFRLRGN